MTPNADYVPCAGCADPDPCGTNCDMWDCEICTAYYETLGPMHPPCKAAMDAYAAERVAPNGSYEREGQDAEPQD